MNMVEITESAQTYLIELLSKQEDQDIGIRIFIADPGTPMAETCIAYCRPGEEQDEDQRVDYEGFTAWIDDRSKPFLIDALVDYAEDRMGGQLTIKAPNSKVPQVSDDSPLEDRINYVLHSQVNPGLAAHGGMVNLVEVVEEGIAPHRHRTRHGQHGGGERIGDLIFHHLRCLAGEAGFDNHLYIGQIGNRVNGCVFE